jgi:hypothetical protein
VYSFVSPALKCCLLPTSSATAKTTLEISSQALTKDEVVLDVLTDAHQWAQHNFADADLGDRRRTRRLVRAAADIAAHPQKSFTQVFDWNDLRGF